MSARIPKIVRTTLLAATVGTAVSISSLAVAQGSPKPFEEVSKGFDKVVSTAEGVSLYNLYLNKKEEKLLAELPRGYEGQRHMIAITQSRGSSFAGLQGPMFYGYWKRFGDRVAFIIPELGTRSTGEPESRSSVDRLFTDTVLFDVPIVANGPSGQPVIDLTQTLLRDMPRVGGMNARLAQVTAAKAFPENIEVRIQAPAQGGQFVEYHFSISSVPRSSSYKPREGDERVGYFQTSYRDLGEYEQDRKTKRYINRWHLEKRDPKLNMSPPKEPIVFYIEHTVPVRYRRYVRDGVLAWNKAFRKIGIDEAIEVYYQDKATGAHMDKDPEDVRYNFIRWLNNDVSTAIGPSRAHPETGQILDADVILTDGWIRAYWGWYHEQSPEIAIEGMTPETLQWLEDYPQWDPRLLLSGPEQREEILALRAERKRRLAAGEPVDPFPSDPALMHHRALSKMADWVGGEHQFCLAARGKAFQMAFASMALDTLDLIPEDQLGSFPSDGDTLDGIPDWFISQMLHELVAHEVGHTLGLRHNFKASSIYSLAEVNSEAHRGTKPIAGSVMDYLPANFNMGSGEVQGDFAMITIGPYDEWAIEYGYTLGDPKEVLKRVADPQLVYLTDEDTNGPDPQAFRYDFSSEPLEYAENQMRIVRQQRENLLERFVKEGQSWSNARRGYQVGLSMQTRMISMMANWIGGANVSRARKGDPDAGPPVTVTEAERQRRALEWVINNTFQDEVFGLTPEILAHMTTDSFAGGGRGGAEATWPVHNNIANLQASALTMIMNPTTLTRVHDNEFRTPADVDAITLAEVVDKITAEIYSELNQQLDGITYTDRQPMISSLRRNLQSGLTDRLIVLSMDDPRLPRPIRTLALHHLRQLNAKIDGLLSKSGTGQMDTYTIAHLEDMHDRVSKALDAVYVANQ